MMFARRSCVLSKGWHQAESASLNDLSGSGELRISQTSEFMRVHLQLPELRAVYLQLQD